MAKYKGIESSSVCCMYFIFVCAMYNHVICGCVSGVTRVCHVIAQHLPSGVTGNSAARKLCRGDTIS